MAALFLLQLGCSDSSSLSSSTARRVAQEHLDLEVPFCIPLLTLTEEAPWHVPDRDPRRETYQKLESLGVVVSRAMEVEVTGYGVFGKQTRMVPGREYALTSDGEQALLTRSTLGLKARCLRFAAAEVDEVLEWTDPAPAMGVIASTVSFTFKPISVAAWAQSPEFGRHYPKWAAQVSPKEPLRREAGVVRTNKGWRPQIASMLQ